MIVSERSSDWIETANATDGTATATRAAPSEGLSHYITSISGTFDGNGNGNGLLLKQAGVEIARWNIHDQLHLEFSSPIRIAPGKAVSVDLDTGGTGVRGDVVVVGYTV